MQQRAADILSAGHPVRPYVVIAAVVIAGLSVHVLLRRPEDWENVYLPAGRRLIEGRDFYDLRSLPFTYPPASAALAALFTAVPAALQLVAWMLANAVALGCFWWCAWRASGGGHLQWPFGAARARRPVTDWREHAVLWLGMAIGLRFVTDVLEHRQTDLFIGALTAGAALAVGRGRWRLAGALCGIGAALKATPVVWIVYFAIRRRAAAAAMLLGVAAGLSLVPDLLSRPSAGGTWLQRWLEVVVQPIVTGSQQMGAWYTAAVFNQSVAGTLHRLAVASPLIHAAQAAILLVGLAATASRGSVARAVSRPALDCAIVILLMVLLAPASGKPHFVVLLLPAYGLARLARLDRDRVSATALLGALVSSLISHRTVAGEALGEWAQWAGAITAAALCLFIGCAAALLTLPRAKAGAAVSADAKLRHHALQSS